MQPQMPLRGLLCSSMSRYPQKLPSLLEAAPCACAQCHQTGWFNVPFRYSYLPQVALEQAEPCKSPSLLALHHPYSSPRSLVGQCCILP